jgi:hypothetical protein
VLDHHHLLSGDIGAWPKKFGLIPWKTQLKADCTRLVKTYDEETYNFYLDRIRATVQPNRDWSEYVERFIHRKRHLFANHRIQHYPCNLQRQGNSPAEANHSSVLQRIGSSFCQSPVKLIHALLNRHREICGERNHFILTHFFKTNSNSDSQPELEKQAATVLGSMGGGTF